LKERIEQQIAHRDKGQKSLGTNTNEVTLGTIKYVLNAILISQENLFN
jgi:hypothetical protein